MTDTQQPLDPHQPEYIKPDEDIIASAIESDWQGTRRYFYGDWHDYKGGVWIRTDAMVVKQDIRERLREWRSAKVSVTANLIKSVETLLRSACYVPNDYINPPSPYLNLTNGLYNLDSMVLEPHNPLAYMTWQLQFGYKRNAARPVTWLNYLKTSLVDENGGADEKMIELLQEALGYTLTSDTKKKTSFWCHGKSNSGKSQLIALIRDMLGPMHTTVDLNQLATNRFLLANVIGKRAITFTEATVGGVLPDAIFKSLVGGEDQIQVDVKNKAPLEFVPQTKVWWAMNEPPRVIDRSDAVYNRIKFILFPREIPQSDRIEGLAEKFKAEYEGIFIWCLLGLSRLRRNGAFTDSGRSTAALTRFKLYNDEEAQFIAECTQRGDYKLPTSVFYKVYGEWRSQNGYAKKSVRAIKRDVERLGLVVTHTSAGNVFLGVGINQSTLNELGIK